MADSVTGSASLEDLMAKFAVEADRIAKRNAEAAEKLAEEIKPVAEASKEASESLAAAAEAFAGPLSGGNSKPAGESPSATAATSLTTRLEEAEHATAALSDSFDSLAKNTAAASAAIGVATGGLSTVLGLLTTGLQMLADAAISTGKKLLSALVNPLEALAQGFRFAAAPTAMMARSMSAAINGMTMAIIGPFQQLANAVGPFVEALNPGLMRLFHVALRDLMATFGVAFTPVIQHVIAVFNKLSSVLTPLMRALAPIVDDLMSRVEGVLVPMVGMIAESFRALAPFIKVVTGAIADMVEGLRVVFAVLQGAMSVLFDEIGKALGVGDLKDLSVQLRNVIHDLVKTFVMFAASIAKYFGVLDPFLNVVGRNLKSLEGTTPGTKAAPQNFRMSGLEQISKDLALAAFSAQGTAGTRVKTEAESLDDIFKLLENIKKEQGTNLEKILKAKLAEYQGEAKKFAESLWDKVQKWVTETGIPMASSFLGEVIKGTGANLANDAGSAVSGYIPAGLRAGALGVANLLSRNA